MSPILSADVYLGTFLQQPDRDFGSISDAELRAKYQEKYERNKITLIVRADEIEMRNFGEEVLRTTYVAHGSTLVAEDHGNYLVLYFQDHDIIQSTFMTFKRVQGE